MTLLWPPLEDYGRIREFCDKEIHAGLQQRLRTKTRNGVAFMLLLDGAFSASEVVGIRKSDILDRKPQTLTQRDDSGEEEWNKIQQEIRKRGLKKALDRWYENHVEKGDKSGYISRHALIGVQINLWRRGNGFSTTQFEQLLGKQRGWLQKVEDGRSGITHKDLWKLCEETAKLEGDLHGMIPPLQVSDIFKWVERKTSLMEMGKWTVHSDYSGPKDIKGGLLLSFAQSIAMSYFEKSVRCPTCENYLFGAGDEKEKVVERIKRKFVQSPPSPPPDSRVHIKTMRKGETYFVPISPDTEGLLEKWRSFSDPWNESEYLFPNRQGKKHVARNTLWEIWSGFSSQAGLRDEYSLRGLRNLALAIRWKEEGDYERFMPYARVKEDRLRYLIGEISKQYDRE